MLLDLKEQGADPKALRNRPKLREDCTKYKEAFNHCSAGRQANETGLQPLPTGEIMLFLFGVGIDDPDERSIHLRLIRAQDNILMDHMRKKMAQSSGKQTT